MQVNDARCASNDVRQNMFSQSIRSRDVTIYVNTEITQATVTDTKMPTRSGPVDVDPIMSTTLLDIVHAETSSSQSDICS